MTTKNMELMTKAESKVFKPLLNGSIKELKAAQLKKKISLSKAALTKYSKKADRQKTGDEKKKWKQAKEATKLFKSLLTKLEKRLQKINASVPLKAAKNFAKANSTLPKSQTLERRQTSRKAQSKAAVLNGQNLKHAPVERIVGFQGALTRKNQGKKDHRNDIPQ